MSEAMVNVLLAGDAETSDMLRRWLAPRGCECQRAESFADACKTLARTHFDIVLCQYALPDHTALPLLDRLEGTQATLLFYSSSGKSSRWLPVIDHGKRCLDRPLLRAPELPNALAGLIDGTRQTRSSRSDGSHGAPNPPAGPQTDPVSSGAR